MALIVISNRSQWCFRLQNLGVHLLSLAFCRWFYPLLPNLSYIFKEMLIMDYYLLSIFFKKLFHLSCLEIWLSRANDIIVKLLKWPRARQGARKVLVSISLFAHRSVSFEAIHVSEINLAPTISIERSVPLLPPHISPDSHIVAALAETSRLLPLPREIPLKISL